MVRLAIYDPGPVLLAATHLDNLVCICLMFCLVVCFVVITRSCS